MNAPAPASSLDQQALGFKLCVDCRHCQPATWTGTHPRAVYECLRYKSLADGVTITTCDYQRGSGLCGVNARGFEPKGVSQ